MKKIRTVLGNISEADVGVVLPHEHIFCYSDYLYEMAGKHYLDKEAVFSWALQRLAYMKETYHLRTLIDCTPINIGRDIPFLKRVSEQTGVNIICSTGFYYTEELLLDRPDAAALSDYMIMDATNTNAGIIKCAVDEKTELAEKILTAAAMAQLKLDLPVIVHTNAKKENGLWALGIILSQGVSPRAVTVSHLSDTDKVDYIKAIAAHGCYLGLDRHYDEQSAGYAEEKIRIINELCAAGYADQILLSHDALFFNGFSNDPLAINPTPRFHYIFEHILPAFSKEQIKKFTADNPLNMLGCR